MAGRQALSPCSAVRNCLIPCLDASLFLNKAIGHWLLTKAWLSKPKPNNNRYISGYKATNCSLTRAIIEEEKRKEIFNKIDTGQDVVVVVVVVFLLLLLLFQIEKR